MNPISQHIDYTHLNPFTVHANLDRLCREAMQHKFVCVCVPPTCVAAAVALLIGSQVKVCSVVGFPHGLQSTEVKCFEAKELVSLGAKELDWVINPFWVKQKSWQVIRSELADFQAICGQNGIISKIIIESSELDFEEIEIICDICTGVSVSYVKTSTGFASKGAELDKVLFMRKCLPSHIKIKASGGIRDLPTARAFIEAGADRIGTSTLIEE